MSHPLPAFPIGNSETRRRWEAGLCPCCAGDLCEWVDGTQSAAIGEEVLICGRCAANDHVASVPGLAEAMLMAIAIRDDKPIEDLLHAI